MGFPRLQYVSLQEGVYIYIMIIYIDVLCLTNNMIVELGCIPKNKVWENDASTSKAANPIRFCRWPSLAHLKSGEKKCDDIKQPIVRGSTE